MSQRLNEYFAEEAADYLQQLSTLLSARASPDPVRFLRLATGVRGSIQMAGAEDLSDLAGRFEILARGLLDGSAEWSDPLGEVSRRTVSEMLVLVHSIGRWGEEEEARVRAAARLWSDPAEEAESDDDEHNVVPIESLFFEDAGPHVIEPHLERDGDVDGGQEEVGADVEAGSPLVSIDQLLYNGPDALRAAMALRPAFDEFARGDATPEKPLPELLDELFDLIALGMPTETTEA